MSETDDPADADLDVEVGPPAESASPAAGGGIVAPRSAQGTETPATVVLIRVELFFQVYPGTTTRDGTPIGIADVPYTITFAGGATANGRTDADGKVSINLQPDSAAELRIFDTDYQVSGRDVLEPVTQLAGVQRRLQMLGFDLGPAGVDGDNGQFTERALLDFQYDAELDIDARIGSETRNTLTSADWANE